MSVVQLECEVSGEGDYGDVSIKAAQQIAFEAHRVLNAHIIWKHGLFRKREMCASGFPVSLSRP